MSQQTLQHSGDSLKKPPPARLTGRGAVVVMFVLFFLGLLGATWLGWAVLAGLAFVIGAVAAARFAQPRDLLAIAVSPPLVFFCALVSVKALTATGNVLLSVAEGSTLTLAGVAPWLIIGTVVNLIIAWLRGLPGCVRDLRRELGPSRHR